MPRGYTPKSGRVMMWGETESHHAWRGSSNSASSPPNLLIPSQTAVVATGTT